MNRGRNIRIIVCLICLAVLGATWALPDNVVKLGQRLETGKVKIRLQQITAENTGRKELVEPNKDLKYIPRIINEESECYVRAKVEFGGAGGMLNEKNLYGVGRDWVKIGEYFYYMKVMGHGQKTDLFKGIHIPEEWEEENTEKLSVRVTAEAIQSRNFEPDFSRELPWGAVELEGSTTSAAVVTSVEGIAVIKFSPGKGLECSTGDLFPAYREMMPGDRLCRELELKNTSTGKLSLCMKIAAGGDGLSRKTLMKVSCGEKVLFKGSVAEACREDELWLPSVGMRKSKKIMIEIELPADTDNAFAGLKDDIAWTIRAEQSDDRAVQTADTSNLVPFAVAAVMALCLMTVLLSGRRKGKK